MVEGSVCMELLSEIWLRLLSGKVKIPMSAALREPVSCFCAIAVSEGGKIKIANIAVKKVFVSDAMVYFFTALYVF